MSHAVDRATSRPPPLSALLRVATDAARAAGKVTLESFGRRMIAERKEDGSPVTAVDRAAEVVLRQKIRSAFPDHTIVGEEGGESAGDPRVTWFLDPIDGTKSYIHGVPLYSVLVAVEVNGRPSVGVIHLPALGETISAARNLGCRWNGRVARVSRTDRLADATVLTTSVRALESAGASFARLASATLTQRGWGDGYGFALVATGRADAIVDTHLHRWDIAPMMPILEEAGGKVTDWGGVRTTIASNFLASNGKLHESLLRLLPKVDSGRRPPAHPRSSPSRTDGARPS